MTFRFGAVLLSDLALFRFRVWRHSRLIVVQVPSAFGRKRGRKFLRPTPTAITTTLRVMPSQLKGKMMCESKPQRQVLRLLVSKRNVKAPRLS